MTTKRLIACFDIIGSRLTKAQKFENNIDIGNVVEYAEKIYNVGVDEIICYDIKASPEKRLANLNVIQKIAKKVFVPFTVGGGIGSLEDMYKILRAGAEKISIDSMAVRKPEIIQQGSKAFGRQCIVVSMQVKKVEPSRSLPSGYEIAIDGARINTGIDAFRWAQRVEELGAGEIVVNSIDNDGTMQGFETVITNMIANKVTIPVIASGGGGSASHIVDVFQKTKATGAVISSMLYSSRAQKNYDIKTLKEVLQKNNVPIRPFQENPAEKDS